MGRTDVGQGDGVKQVKSPRGVTRTALNRTAKKQPKHVTQRHSGQHAPQSATGTEHENQGRNVRPNRAYRAGCLNCGLYLAF